MLSRRNASLLMLLGASLAVGCDDDDSPSGDKTPADGQTIAEIASGNPDFSLLVAAATRAGLVETLDGPGALTVFAPTNAAFEASGITEEMVETMDEAALAQILTYHALAAEVKAADVESGIASTVAELSLVIDASDGVVLNGGNEVTGGAAVVTADIDATNGVIHVIDRVLLPPTVADLARYAGLTTLAGALDDAELVETLSGDGPFTVFAPTNEAFAALEAVPEGEALAAVLTYHVVAGDVGSDAVPAAASSLSANEYGDALTLLFDTSGGVSINGGQGTVVVTDVRGTNGVVHVIDGVLLPMNVVDAAVAAGLTELVGAVGAAADLDEDTTVAEALSAQAPYTVFAPTNAAFEAISEVAEGLTAEQLRDVLLYHVLDTETFPAPVLAADLPEAETELKTLNGANATLDPTKAPPELEGAKIVSTDVVVTNGVVHVIDAVILPPS